MQGACASTPYPVLHIQRVAMDDTRGARLHDTMTERHVGASAYDPVA